jgi:hypothetical protein
MALIFAMFGVARGNTDKTTDPVDSQEVKSVVVDVNDEKDKTDLQDDALKDGGSDKAGIADYASKALCDGGKACCCDCATQAASDKAAGEAYKDPFFNNNFDYLCDPCYCDWHLGESLKRLCLGDCIKIDVGGQYRLRHHSERNMRILRVQNPVPWVWQGLTGADDDFLLHRTRFYVNAELGDRVRFYGEMLDAVSNYENITPRFIEENRAEMQNLFLDVTLLNHCCGKLSARVGRQELLYGAQRLISPLDWANTRRTFDGAKLFWKGQDWDIDGFWTRPLKRINPAYLTRLDPPFWDAEFYGIYSTYKGLPSGDKVDFYWIALDRHDLNFLYDTLGSRLYGSRGDWLYEIEAGYQLGRNRNGSDHSAGAWTVGLGRKNDCHPWKPTLWCYYDWASGSRTTDETDVANGWHHNFPLAHKYLGFMDFFARSNIEDANMLLTMQPHDKLKLLFWYHYFRLQNINDVPYNVNMTPYTLAPSGSSDLGHELDCVATLLISPRMNLLFGYSHFWSGNYYRTTADLPFRGDADFFYTQLTLNF